jgi:hypothetical protein
MIRRPMRTHFSFPALMSRLSVQCVLPIILAASSIGRSGSKASLFAPASLRLPADIFSPESDKSLAELWVASTVVRCHKTLWTSESRCAPFFKWKLSRGGRALRPRPSTFTETVLCPTKVERLQGIGTSKQFPRSGTLFLLRPGSPQSWKRFRDALKSFPLG